MKNLLLTIFVASLFVTTPLLAQTIPVWPGDVNNNGQVTNVDILYLGLGFDSQGPPRDTSQDGNDWLERQATPWNTFIIDTTLNGALADCNGDGFVDTFDLAAINQNYLLTTGAGNRPDSTIPSTPNYPPLFFQTPPDSIEENTTVVLDLHLGNTQLPVDSFYGIAFTIEFDTAVISRGSWAALATSSFAPAFSYEITFLKELYDSARVDIAYSLTPNAGTITSVSTDSSILALSFIIEDNLIGIAQLDPTLDLRFSNITMIDGNGHLQGANAIDLSIPLKVIDTGVGINELEAKLQVYPNPAQDQLHINGINNIDLLTITDLAGATVLTHVPTNGSATQTLNTEALSNGLYLLQVQTSKGTIRKKVLIAR